MKKRINVEIGMANQMMLCMGMCQGTMSCCRMENRRCSVG